jgi:hypothetical protein
MRLSAGWRRRSERYDFLSEMRNGRFDLPEGDAYDRTAIQNLGLLRRAQGRPALV